MYWGHRIESGPSASCADDADGIPQPRSRPGKLHFACYCSHPASSICWLEKLKQKTPKKQPEKAAARKYMKIRLGYKLSPHAEAHGAAWGSSIWVTEMKCQEEEEQTEKKNEHGGKKEMKPGELCPLWD